MRKIVRLMKNWQFIGPEGNTTTVDLPHTWNAIDGQDGGNDYWRGTCVYRTSFAAPAFEEVSQQVWLQFEGVNASAKVILNDTEVCVHDGGYSTFRANITTLLREENILTVEVDNSVNDHVYPQKADFTFYGGIYRDVSLLVVHQDHIALGHYGDTGVKVTPTLCKDHTADIRVETRLEGQGTVRVTLNDAEGNTVAAAEGKDVTMTLAHPHLWDGVKDPYLYTCVVELEQGGEPGMNHKGLVTFDRKTKKDSFYLYKAWWSDEAFVHICSKRFTDRTASEIEVKVYSNQKTVALFADGQKIAEQTGEHVFPFKVPLNGEVKLQAVAGECIDTASFRKVDTPNPSYKLVKTKSKSANWV